MWKQYICMFMFSLIIFTSGCTKSAKVPVTTGNETMQFTAPEGKGAVYLYRSSKALLPEQQFKIRINGRDAGKCGPGAYFKLELKPGTYTITSSSTESTATVRIEVETGRLYFYKQVVRMGLAKGGRIFIEEVDMVEAKKEISGLKQLANAYSPD